MLCFIVQINAQNIYKDPANPVESRVKDLLSRMTLEEKIGQMQQNSLGQMGDDVFTLIRQGKVGSYLNAGELKDKILLQKIAVEESRLGIPLIFGRDVIHGYRTVFPIPLGLSASWDTGLVRQASSIAAQEAAEAGVHWTFAPMLDISRDPRWGRIAESCGEDPYLASQMGEAMVRGFQGESLKSRNSIAACLKHYVGYGAAEAGKDYNTTYIPERLLRDVYLVPFRNSVAAGAATLMSAFNDLNGIPASGNEFTLRQVLRSEWKFDGFVVSDWTSVEEMIKHGYCKDREEAALKALRAGVNMEMVSTTYAENLKKLIENGSITEAQIDEMVSGILNVKFRLGLFEDPYKQPKDNKTLSKEFLDAAQRAAGESVVMLQNENNVLPLSKENLNTLAIIGPLSDDPRAQLGCWVPDGRSENTVTPLTAIKQLLADKVKVLYFKGMDNIKSMSRDKFDEAVGIAKKSDAVIIFAGEDDQLSGEAHSRAFLNLPGVQEDLIKEVSAAGKPVVLVIMAGRPLTFSSILSDVKAILYAWHPGTMGGAALADILFGEVSPSGKLPVTFPRTIGQVPIYYSHKNTGRPPSGKELGITMGTPENPIDYVSYYLDVDYTPAYPFGFGLSYSKFEYSGLKLSANEVKAGGRIEVSVRVRNAGKYDADEVVQLYIRDLYGSVTRPVKELKKFSRISLKQNETKEVKFILTTDDLKFYDKDMNYTVEPGEFKLWVGSNSDEGLSADFKVL